MSRRRPERGADNRFVRAAISSATLIIVGAAVILSTPQPNHAQTGPSPGTQKPGPGKASKSPEDIAAAKAKWQALKGARETKAKGAEAAKAEKQAKAKFEKQAKKAAKEDDGEDDESGRKKRCPPGETLDKRSRGGCI